MSGFKLLAIRPLKGCHSQFRKNLNEGEVYKFYQDYKFLDASGNEIQHNTENQNNNVAKVEIPVDELDLYSLINSDLKINVSAVVGKNGSGKSALSELFLLCLFFISNNNKFIDKASLFSYKKDSTSKDKREIDKELKNFEADIETIKSDLKVEFYYLLNDAVIQIKIIDGKVTYKKSIKIEGGFSLSNSVYEPFERDTFFFYSMVVNYSLYSFNTGEIGMWVKAFFHKNDGYQMPVVINPFRIKGNIDINSENYLTRSRLLANILSIEYFKNIHKKSSIRSIEIKQDIKKDKSISDSKRIEISGKIIKPLFKMFFPGEGEYPSIDSTKLKIAEAYLINKIQDVLHKLRSREGTSIDAIIKSKDHENSVKLLYEDRSHVTLKIRQTLNFIREDIFNIDDETLKTTLDFAITNKKINKLSEKEWFTETQDYIPPPIFMSIIHFENGSTFDTLSSGEKQLICSLNSIVYHIKNLDSVHKAIESKDEGGDEKKIKLIKYDAVNLILDETELYYHPEFQQQTINQLLDIINQAQFIHIANINILFLTHSPFILSDIPSSNILKLIEGDSIKEKHKSFGANIHDLLANDFFLKDGFMGDFAKNEIKNVIEALNYTHLNNLKIEKQTQLNSTDDGNFKNRIESELKDVEHKLAKIKKPKEKYNEEYCKKVIEVVGEPILYMSLMELYTLAYKGSKDTFIDEQIRKLESLKNDSN
jgi:predicted ATPase